jgi:SAM-dependent methyltransferase
VRGRRVLFDGIADAYEVRPPYPDWLFDRLRTVHGVGPGHVVLEIGPGSGQATIPLLDLGCRVTAVELGANLADRLATRTAGRPIGIVRSSFEDADLPLGWFDTVLSASAFHWVDPDVGVPKAFDVLRPGGWFVLVWNVFGDPSRPDPFHTALAEMLERVEPQLSAPAVPGKNMPDLAAWRAVVDDRAAFEPATADVFRWSATHSTAELQALFATFSPWIALGPEREAEMLDELGRLADEQFDGRVTRPYQTVAVSARKP